MHRKQASISSFRISFWQWGKYNLLCLCSCLQFVSLDPSSKCFSTLWLALFVIPLFISLTPFLPPSLPPLSLLLFLSFFLSYKRKGEEKFIVESETFTVNKARFFRSGYSFCKEENTTFYVYVYAFNSPLWIQIPGSKYFSTVWLALFVILLYLSLTPSVQPTLPPPLSLTLSLFSSLSLTISLYSISLNHILVLCGISFLFLYG